MVVLDQEPEMSGINLGNALLVALVAPTTFDIGLGDLAVPAGAAFAVPADLIPGQDLRIEPGAITPGPPISTSTSHVTLRTFNLPPPYPPSMDQRSRSPTCPLFLG